MALACLLFPVTAGARIEDCTKTSERPGGFCDDNHPDDMSGKFPYPCFPVNLYSSLVTLLQAPVLGGYVRGEYPFSVLLRPCFIYRSMR